MTLKDTWGKKTGGKTEEKRQGEKEVHWKLNYQYTIQNSNDSTALKKLSC